MPTNSYQLFWPVSSSGPHCLHGGGCEARSASSKHPPHPNHCPPQHLPPPHPRHHTHTHCFLPSPALAGTAGPITHTGANIAESDLHSATVQPVSFTFIMFPRPWMLAPLPLSLSFVRGPGPLPGNRHSASSCPPGLSGPRGQTIIQAEPSACGRERAQRNLHPPPPPQGSVLSLGAYQVFPTSACPPPLTALPLTGLPVRL